MGVIYRCSKHASSCSISNNDRDEDIEQIQQTEKLLGGGNEETALCEVEDCNEVVSSSDKVSYAHYHNYKRFLI